MCPEQEQQEHKPKFKNTKLKSKNHNPKNTNTNLATDQPNQTQKQQTQTQQLIFLVNQTQKQQTQTQTSIRIQKQTQQSISKKPVIHLQKTQKTQIQTQTQIQPSSFSRGASSLCLPHSSRFLIASWANAFSLLNKTCNSDFILSVASRAYLSRSSSVRSSWNLSTDTSSVLRLFIKISTDLSPSSTSLSTALTSSFPLPLAIS